MISVIHWDGSSDTNENADSFSALFDELQTSDREHGDVSVVHEESGWSLSAHRDGRMIFENLSSGGQRHIRFASKERIIELWILLLNDDVDAILSEPWLPGYGS